MDKNLTSGTVWKKLLLFVVPIFGANLLQAMYGTVDLLVVGLFSDSAAVSAVSTGSTTMQTITGIITGLTMGCTILLGQNIGRKDKAAAGRTVGSAIYLFLGLGLVLTFLMAFLAGTLAGVMNAPAEAFAGTKSYLRICGLGIIAIVLFNAISGMFRGIGDSKTPLILMGVACAGNIAGDLILVGAFRLGVAGAAIATVGAQGLSVICALFIIAKRKYDVISDKKALKPYAFETKTILKFGLPIAAQEALTGVSFMVILAILNSFGLTASAGVGVAEKICALMFIVPGAFMSGVSSFCAQNVGAGRYDRARKAMLCGIVVSVCTGLCMFAVSFFHGTALAGFFTTDTSVMAAAGDYLRSYSIDCVIVGINFCMMGYLNGNGKTSFVALQGILSTFLVRIPVSYFMSKVPGVTLFQIGFATPLATLFGIILTGSYLFYFEKKMKTKRNTFC